MKLQPESKWVLVRKLDLNIERTDEPTILKLDSAVEWIKKEKPFLWIGSPFSVPSPSNLPSGYAVTQSLFNLLFPLEGQMSEQKRELLINELIPKWPLETLFDEFEWLHYDLSKSLLEFFQHLDNKASPNVLHAAIIKYYENGFSKVPLCVTTNWDTLIEKAFRKKGYTVFSGGPTTNLREFFIKSSFQQKTISILHPHGSFETKDIVCSFIHEQQQPVSMLNMDFIFQPTLFLGYSGYEPSLYRYLEHNSGQLWCIKNEEDLNIPAKRRLLCRPNTFVYIGDMLDLLKAIGILHQEIDLATPFLGHGKIPPKVADVIRMAILASIGPNISSTLLEEMLLSIYDEPEYTFRFTSIVRAIENHMRNRIPHPGIPLGLMAAAHFRSHEQIWISLIAYLLRSSRKVDDRMIRQILAFAKQASDTYKKTQLHDIEKFVQELRNVRVRFYKYFLGEAEKEDDIKELLYHIPAFVLGDIALGGEMAEVAAFKSIRDGEFESAKGYFDSAATYFYLKGLWNAGKLNEWASKNIDSVRKHAKGNSLFIPITV